MIRKILMPVTIGAALGLSGLAYAQSQKPAYKEAQPSANAVVKDKSVNPDATMSKKLYKNSESKANATVKDKSVSPDATMNKKLYNESQRSATPGVKKSN